MAQVGAPTDAGALLSAPGADTTTLSIGCVSGRPCGTQQGKGHAGAAAVMRLLHACEQRPCSHAAVLQR